MRKKNNNQRRTSEGFVAISDVLAPMMGQLRQHDAGLEKIWPLWPAIVGEVIAAQTKPAGYKQRLLIVNVSSAPWLQQMQFLKADITAKVNQALEGPKIDEIRFRIGPID